MILLLKTAPLENDLTGYSLYCLKRFVLFISLATFLVFYILATVLCFYSLFLVYVVLFYVFVAAMKLFFFY